MKIKSLTTELMVENIAKSKEFYEKVLGFSSLVNVPEEDPFFVIMKNNSVQIMLYERYHFVEEIPRFEKLKTGGTIALYLEVENIKEILEKIKSQIRIIQELHDTDYGTSEFSFEDINGYVWMLSEKIKDS